MGDLTEEQQAVATSPVSAHLLVTAGPGTGKTHTLVGRVESLAAAGVPPGSGILALSFSRAAVYEMRKRLKASDSDAAYLSARTFDSFATWLLSTLEPEGGWMSAGYEGRVVHATKRLEEARREGILAEIEHIIVDEAQDLVGSRAEFVMRLLAVADRGFTVFGDPAQGIYNFQLANPDERRDGSARLFAWLRKSFVDLQEFSLTNNFRARTNDARVALKFGPMLNAPDPDYDEIEQALRTVLTRAQTLGKVNEAAFLLKRKATESGILCRTNGEALVVSKTLFDEGVPHSVRRSATDRVVGRWVADALAFSSERVLTRDEVVDRLEYIELPSELDADSAWRALKRMDAPARRRSEDLDLGELANRLRVGNVPDQLVAREAEPLVVSTIHRAKGLEFDRVLIVEPFDSDDEAMSAEEARTLFVALTRPRDELFHLAPINTRYLSKSEWDGERWYRRGRKKWQRLGVEIRGDDAESELPAGEFEHLADPVETQKYISDAVNVGDELELRLHMTMEHGNERAYYEILHDGRHVGVTRNAFGASFFGILKAWRTFEVNWPRAITQIRVESVDTVAGTEAAGKRAGLGPSGLWLRVRPLGLGWIDWGKDE